MASYQEDDEEKKGSRAHVKRWAFTHYGVDDKRPLFPLEKIEYLIEGEEVCPSTGRRHVQGYVHFKKEQRISSIRKIAPISKLFRARGTGKQNYLYCSKEENYKEYGTRPDDEDDREDPWKLALNSETVEAGLQIIKDKRPRDYCLRGGEIEQNLKRHKSEKYKPSHELTEFNVEEMDLVKPVLLHGSSNIGKTQFALAHFKNPLLCSHIDGLKKLSPDNDGIVFDDMSFRHMPVETVIHLLDIEEGRDIHCRNTNARIPKGMKRIFTHNTPNPFYNEMINEHQKTAVDRRVRKVEVNEKLY